jgi:hypothetical protein
MYWNFVAIDGVIKNQLDKYATGCNTQRQKETNFVIARSYSALVHADMQIDLYRFCC